MRLLADEGGAFRQPDALSVCRDWDRIHDAFLRAMMSAMRRIEQSAAVLGHLCQPDSIWDDANQRALHQGIFDSWATERLLAGVKEKLDFLGARSAQLAGLLSGFFQDRMNVIMTVFTFVTFAGVMAFIWQRRGIADTDPPRPRPSAAG